MERNQRIEEELFPFYALDALTDEERAEVDGYVAGNPEAAARLAAMMPAAADLVAATTPVAPSSAVKSGLMARVAADLAAEAGAGEVRATVSAKTPPPRPARPVAGAQSAPRRAWWDRLAPAVAAFALVALLASAVLAVRLSRQVSDLRGQIAALEAGDETLRAEVGALQTENETLRRELAARDDLLAQYIRPGAVTVAIGDATGDHPTAAGTLTTDPTTGSATLRVANLPPLDPGTTYQAWVIVGETPVSAGTFAVDENGAGTHVFSGELPGDFDAIGVSLEPEGGSPAPTPGNIILLGGAF